MEKKEKYILKNQIHFGSLKLAVPRGTVVTVDRKTGSADFNGALHEDFNMHEIDMMVKAGYMLPYNDGKTQVDTTVKVSSRVKPQKKMEVRQSDSDMVARDIEPAPKTKKGHAIEEDEMLEGKKGDPIRVIREKAEEPEARGMKVIRNDAEPDEKDLNGNGTPLESVTDDMKVVRKIAGAKTKDADGNIDVNEEKLQTASQDAAAANMGQDARVVKMIGKSEGTKAVNAGNKLVAKRPAGADSEAKAKAAAESRKAQAAKKRAEAAGTTTKKKK